MFLKSHGLLFHVLEAARKASKNKAKQSDVHFEIGEVLRNAPNMPGGSNFVKRQGLQGRKRMAPAGDTTSSTQDKRPRVDSSSESDD
ncbi:hypothetical protein LSAT2_018987 [Lamellibrachia satsuma]|nr:hypothetical protein LSAT2_018987 [Lamellibrachia satsuma]